MVVELRRVISGQGYCGPWAHTVLSSWSIPRAGAAAPSQLRAAHSFLSDRFKQSLEAGKRIRWVLLPY